jgi:predicted transposase/invertase (TIGR01784 family)
MESDNDNKNRPLVSFDWAVKRLLRNKANFEVVEGFLSELLGRQVKITSVLESESNKKTSNDKHNQVDVIVESNENEVILIELQFRPDADYFQRMLYGVSEAVVERLVEGDSYMKIQKIYSINIVYFDLGQGKDYVYHSKVDFRGLHYDDDTLNLSQIQRDLFKQRKAGDLFPEYYVLKINQFNDVALNTLDEWIYFFKHDKVKEGSKAQGLLKAQELLDYNRLSPAEKAEYDYIQKLRSRDRSEYQTAIDTGKLNAKLEYDGVIAEKDKAIEQKDKTIEQKDKAIEQKDKTIEEQTKEMQEMKEKLAEMERLLKEKQG